MKYYTGAAILLTAPVVLLSMTTKATFAAPGAKGPFTLNVGPSFLLDSTAKNATSSTGFHVGGTYDVSQPSSLVLGKSSVDVDYDSFSGHGNKINRTLSGYVYRKSFGPSVKGSPVPYFGAGIGVAFTSVKTTTTTQSQGSGGGSITSSATKNNTSVGGKLLVGIEADSGVYGEAVLTLSGKVNGLTTNTIGANVGYRF